MKGAFFTFAFTVTLFPALYFLVPLLLTFPFPILLTDRTYLCFFVLGGGFVPKPEPRLLFRNHHNNPITVRIIPIMNVIPDS